MVIIPQFFRRNVGASLQSLGFLFTANFYEPTPVISQSTSPARTNESVVRLSRSNQCPLPVATAPTMKRKYAAKQQIPITDNPIWIQPMMIPAVARPSPEARGGRARVSLRASYPVTKATMLPIRGNMVNPKIPAIKLIVASVLDGSIG